MEDRYNEHNDNGFNVLFNVEISASAFGMH
jgi:hypothetical protein